MLPTWAVLRVELVTTVRCLSERFAGTRYGLLRWRLFCNSEPLGKNAGIVKQPRCLDRPQQFSTELSRLARRT